jgi:flagellar basal body-associated protein FliL
MAEDGSGEARSVREKILISTLVLIFLIVVVAITYWMFRG